MSVYEIVHVYTRETLDTVEATCPVDALAAYSIAQGFADPRETAVELPYWDGYSREGDPFYLRDDGRLSMFFTNYEVLAQSAELTKEAT